jgi:xylulokinase
MIASIMNLTLEIPRSVEGPSMGGAMLAAVACGAFQDVAEACQKIVKITGTVEPDPVLTQKYEERYQQFRQIYPAVRELFPKLQ